VIEIVFNVDAWIFAQFKEHLPPPSFTPKQASNSSTVQGGGKRRCVGMAGALKQSFVSERQDILAALVC